MLKNLFLLLLFQLLFLPIVCKEKPRILLVVNKFPRITETFILEQLKVLINEGFDIKILSVWKDEVGIIQKDIIKYNLLEKATYIKLYDEKKHDKLCSFINNGDFDLLYCQYDRIGRIFAKLIDEKKIKGKLICCIRGGNLVKKIEKDTFGFDLLFSHASFVLPVNNYFKEILLEKNYPKDKIIVQHSAIDVSKFSFQEKNYNKKNVNIVSINRLIKGKGIDLAVKAMIKICKRYPEVRYYVIGNGVLFNSLVELVKKTNLQDRIFFMGWQSHEKVKQLLCDSQIFLLASTGTDGIPNVIMEASASGLPIVSTRYGGIPEVVQNENSGFLVSPGNIDEIIFAIKNLLDSPEIWSVMGKKGRAIIEKNFNIKIEGKALVDIFRLVLSGKDEEVVKKFSNRYKMPV